MTPQDAAIPVEGDGGAAQYEWAIGPIEGITTAWHEVPLEIVVPVGTTVPFKCGVSASADVAWNLAPAIRSTRSGSIASYQFGAPGRYTITAAVESNGDGHGTGKDRPVESAPITHSCLVIAVPAAAQPVVVESLQPRVGSQRLAESSSNYETMRVFFNGYISPLRKVGRDAYRTSVGTPIVLETTLADSRFTSLVETRISGQRPLLGVSEIRIAAPGQHTVSVGPPTAPVTFTLETFATKITSHHKGQEIVYDGVPTTFVAQTDPPGFEKEITWLASTKFGHVTPVMGSGPTFTVTFSNTSVRDPGNSDSPWLGARADNSVYSQDIPSTPWQAAYDGGDHVLPIGGKGVFTASATNVDSVTIVAKDSGGLDIPGGRVGLKPGKCLAIFYPGAAHYVVRTRNIPSVPNATGLYYSGDVAPPGITTSTLTCQLGPFEVLNSSVAGNYSVKVSAKNAQGDSDCPLVLRCYTRPDPPAPGGGDATLIGTFVIIQGLEGTLIRSNPTNHIIEYWVFCDGALLENCRFTVVETKGPF